MGLQYRETFGGEVRDVETDDGHREIEAKVCSYNAEPDTYNTTWTRETFEEGLREQLPVACWAHDRSQVIGSVREYRNAEDGLYVTIRMADFDAVPEARRAYSLIKDGHLTGWSFGFDNGKTRPDPNHRGAAQYVTAKMYEVSPVVRAAIAGTGTVGVRSQQVLQKADTLGGLRGLITDGVLTAAEARQVLGLGVRTKDPTDAEPEVETAVEKETDDPETEIESTTTEADDDPEQVVTELGQELQRAADLPETVVTAYNRLVQSMGIRADAPAKPYGDVTYADPGYQDDNKKRYPVDTADHVRAAWSYINQTKNASKYSAEQLSAIKSKIRAAAKRLGVEIAESRAAEPELRTNDELAEIFNRTLGVRAAGK